MTTRENVQGTFVSSSKETIIYYMALLENLVG